MTRSRFLYPNALALLFLWGCGEEAAAVSPSAIDAGLAVDAAPTADGGEAADPDGGRPGATADVGSASPDEDGNAHPDDGITIPLGPEGVEGSTAHAGDLDYFTFDASAGGVYAVTMTLDDTAATPPSLTLFDPDFSPIVVRHGTVDLGCLDEEENLELVVRAERDGEYTFEVAANEDFGPFPWGTPWTLRVRHLSDVSSVVLVEETGESPDDAPVVSTPRRCILGWFDAEGEHDLVRVALSEPYLVAPLDAAELGSTRAPDVAEELRDGDVWTATGAGSLLLSGVPTALLRIGIDVDDVEGPDVPPPPVGHFPLWALRLHPIDARIEAAETTNGSLGAAEALASPGSCDAPRWLVVDVPEGDVDYFELGGREGPVAISCDTYGSGAVVTLELRNATDGIISESEGKRGLDLAASAPRPVWLRFQGAAGRPDVSSRVMACRITSEPCDGP